jgi:3-oxoacyl-[acyl-carrier-protein] synthase-1
MAKIKILNYEIASAQGDKEATTQAIKNGAIKSSSKIVSMQDEAMKIPYFTLPQSVEDEFDAIYEAMKKVVEKTIVNLSSEQKARTALLLGTSLVDDNLVKAVEHTIYDYKKTPYSSSKRSIDSLCRDMADELGLNSFTMTISTACTSSVNALLEAKNLLECELFEYVLVVGLEISSVMMSSGFASMKLLSQESQKPFDKSRDGLVLGEAIAAVLVGEGESLWSIAGGYSNCNSVNITSVSASGEEYVDVMQKALLNSNLEAADIDILKAHATATPTNDLSEINAISKIFTNDICFTALKPYVGHTLGACGALEVAMLLSCVDAGFIPKTIGHSASIIPEYQPLLQERAYGGEKNFMLNYFGFGGNNTSLILQRNHQ